MAWWQWADNEEKQNWLIDHFKRNYPGRFNYPDASSWARFESVAPMLEEALTEAERIRVKQAYRKHKYDSKMRIQGFKIVRFKLHSSTLSELTKLAKKAFQGDQTATIEALIRGSYTDVIALQNAEKMAKIEADRFKAIRQNNNRFHKLISNKASQDRCLEELRSMEYQCAELQHEIEEKNLELESLRQKLDKKDEKIRHLENTLKHKNNAYRILKFE
ncbi:hypothetical protein [Vibrio coralliilyticus]|uniref:hypothetical protein n=1 Tax=Vibrio coralliilyticus TaxID=190893 RepID=UPI002FD7488C